MWSRTTSSSDCANNFQDIQFIREASDVQFDETGNRKRKHWYGDENEIEMEQQERKHREMEQQERKHREMVNKEFKAFAEKIAEAASTSVSASIPKANVSY